MLHRALEDAESLRLRCRKANDALLAHWRKEHGNLTPKNKFS